MSLDRHFNLLKIPRRVPKASLDLPAHVIPLTLRSRRLNPHQPARTQSVPPPPSLPTWWEQLLSEEYSTVTPFTRPRFVGSSSNGRTPERYRAPATAHSKATAVPLEVGEVTDRPSRRERPAVAVTPAAVNHRERHLSPFWVDVNRPRVSVVIPARNEAANLPYVLPLIPAWVHEIVLVDGRSTDGTCDVARSLQPDIRIIQERAPGKGAALRTGFAAATGDIVIMLDADGSTDPSEIPAFVGGLLAGADFVKGSRFVQGAGTADMSTFRRLGNWGFVWMVRLMFGGNFTDLCYGYNAFWKHVLDHLELDGDGFEIETMMNVRALRAGLRVAEVPSFEAERVHGTSNLRAIPDGWRVLKTLFKERFTRRNAGPLRQRSRPLALASEIEEYAQHSF